jgi:hypothetical protein
MFTYSSEARMQDLIAKANKPIAKLGLTPVTVVSCTPRKVRNGFDSLGNPRFLTVYDAELSIPQALVQIADKQVVARLQGIEGQNMITRFSDDPALDLDTYRNAPIICQHCGLNRSRKASWVVQDALGGLKQIGDSCVTLYFGVDIESLLATADKVYRTLGSDDEEEFGNGRSVQFSFELFASAVLWKTLTSGFVTKKQAEATDGQSTCAVAEELAGPVPERGSLSRERYDRDLAALRQWRSTFTDQQNLFEQALDWWMEKDVKGLSEFEHNCRLAIMSQDPRFLGLAAFALKLWANETFARKSSSTVTSAWVGEIKQRLTTTATVARLGSFETQYGVTTVVTFHDATGNVLVWKASCDPKVTLGAAYKVTGTITKHDDYKGTKQTVLSRCTLTPQE